MVAAKMPKGRKSYVHSIKEQNGGYPTSNHLKHAKYQYSVILVSILILIYIYSFLFTVKVAEQTA